MFSHFLIVSATVIEITNSILNATLSEYKIPSLTIFYTVTRVKPVLKPSFEEEERKRHDFGVLGIQGIASHPCSASSVCLPLHFCCVQVRSVSPMQAQSGCEAFSEIDVNSFFSACCYSLLNKM